LYSCLLDLVLQVDGALTSGSHLCVSKCALSSEEREKLATSLSQNDAEMTRPEKEDRYKYTEHK